MFVTLEFYYSMTKLFTQTFLESWAPIFLKLPIFMTLCALLVVLPTCKRGLALPQRRLAETLVSHVINWAVQATLTFKML